MGEQTVKNIARPVRVFRVQMEPGQDSPPSRTLTLPQTFNRRTAVFEFERRSEQVVLQRRSPKI
jgi:hypothetical protein